MKNNSSEKNVLHEEEACRDSRDNHGRSLVVALAAIVLFFFFISVGIAVGKKLEMIEIDSEEDGHSAVVTAPQNKEPSDDGEDDPIFEAVHGVSDAESLKDWLKKWSQNGGAKLYSRNVVTCLLCGTDSDDGTINGGRADAMMLVSVNKKNDTITLVSLMRDSYSFADINGSARYCKLNAVYNFGGPAALLETVENNYKIKIDCYVCVDFKTFPKVIDALGGVPVEVKRYEAAYINRTTSLSVESGDSVVLSGAQALVLARIRHCDADGDISRTRRQRRIIEAVITKASDASILRFNDMLNNLLPYVRTDCPKSGILSLGAQAVIGGWAGFKVGQMLSPCVSADGKEAVTGKDAYIYVNSASIKEFVWIVDYQLEARRIQTALYGTTNIGLESNRSSPFDFIRLL